MANEIGILLGFFTIFLILLLNFVKYKTIVNDFFEPTTFYMAFILLFFIINFTTDFEYSMNTVMVVFVGSIFYIIGYYSKIYLIFNPKSDFYKFDFKKDLSPKGYLARTIIIAFFNVVIVLLKLRSYNISFSSFLSNMMLLSSAVKVGGYVWISLSYPLSVLNYINIYRFMQNKKVPALALVIFCQLIITVSQFQTSRFIYIVNLILLPLLLKMIFIDRRPRFNLKFIIISIAILPLMIILNEIRHGSIAELSFSFNSLLGYFQDSLKGDTIPGRSLDDLVRFVDMNYHFNYGKFILYQILAIIPRFIWVTKPIVSFCYEYTILVMNLDPVLQKTMTFTIFDSYTIFSYPGLIFMQLFLGAFSRWMYHLLYNKKNIFSLAFVIPFILNYINTLRGSFVDQISLFILYTFINIIIYYFYRVFYGRQMIRMGE